MKRLHQLLFALTIIFLGSCGGPAPSTPDDQKRQEKSANNQLDSLINTADTSKVSSQLYPPNASELDQSALLDLAEQHIDDKNFAYARNFIQRAAERDSNSARFLDLKGRFLLLGNRSQQAFKTWKRCTELHADEVGCRIHLSELQLTLGLHRDALQTANSIIKIDRQVPEGFFLKGMAIRALNGDTTGAIPYFQQAVDLRNDYVEALDMLGVIYAQRKDSLALSYYRNVLRYEPDRADIYYKIGVFHMEKRDWNKAMAAYETAVKIDPKNADSYYNLGFILTQLQVYDKARDNFARAISVSQRNFKAHYGRGFSFEMLGDLTNAATDYRTALSIRPNHQASAEALARVKKKMAD